MYRQFDEGRSTAHDSSSFSTRRNITRVLLWVLGAGLAFSGIMKLTTPSAPVPLDIAVPLGPWKTGIIGVTEIAVGTVAMVGAPMWLSWRITFAWVLVLLASAVYLWGADSPSCGCLGQIKTPPVVMALVDLTALLSLITFAPTRYPGESTERIRNAIHAIAWPAAIGTIGVIMFTVLIVTPASDVLPNHSRAMAQQYSLDPVDVVGRDAGELPFLGDVSLESVIVILRRNNSNAQRATPPSEVAQWPPSTAVWLNRTLRYRSHPTRGSPDRLLMRPRIRKSPSFPIAAMSSE